MKTPQRLADENAMEIAVQHGGSNHQWDYMRNKQLADLISTHLLPLYECVEALRQAENHFKVVTPLAHAGSIMYIERMTQASDIDHAFTRYHQWLTINPENKNV